MIRRMLTAVAVIVLLLSGTAAGCENDCPTPRNKGVCLQEW